MADAVAGVVATLVAIAFGLSTFERFLSHRKRYELAWSVALGAFAVASAALAVGASAGWSGADFRVFYLFGAIVNVPLLALGSIYLLAGEAIGDISAAIVLLGSGYSIGVVATTRFTHRLPDHVLAQGSHVFPPLLSWLAGIGSGGGTIVIVAGALYSVARRRGPRLAVANSVIALGTLVTGASGIANSVFDKMTAFSIALGLGISIIFVGFLLTQGPAKRGLSPLQ